MKLDRSEIARYLGYGSVSLDGEVNTLADQCEEELLRQARPRKVGRRLKVDELPFWSDSRDLQQHLRNCREVYLIAVTLGSEADRLLRLWSVQHMGKAAVGQAVAAVLMDNCCDNYVLELEGNVAEGEYLLPPFSPGYGDFALSWQRKLLDLLDAGRRIGVTLTEGGMLVPEKTVTAVVGISRVAAERCRTACHACEKSDCKFRKGAAL